MTAWRCRANSRRSWSTAPAACRAAATASIGAAESGAPATALFRLALEQAPAGSVLHAAADEGVPIRAIAGVIGRHLNVPVAAIAPGDAAGHFAWLGGFIGTDSPASSTLTRQLLGWQPAQPGLLDDLDKGHYFHSAPA